MIKELFEEKGKMNMKLLSTLVSASLLLLAATGFGQEKSPEKPKELKNQTHCPVMGGKIDSTVFTDIQGQRVYHCCPACIPKIKADPDKYFKKAAAQGVIFENIQKTCPVSGETIDKSKFVDFEGRRVYFCCNQCLKDFNKDPQKFLSKMTESSEKPSADMEKKRDTNEGHGDHHHGH